MYGGEIEEFISLIPFMRSAFNGIFSLDNKPEVKNNFI